ncbi:MAG: hypothetical protein WCF55_21740, partial [Pseudolabrys sp.]
RSCLRRLAVSSAHRSNRCRRKSQTLKARIAELEASGIKYVGTYQRAAEYRRGDVNHEGGMWVATCAVPPHEVPGKSVCWQLSDKSYSERRGNAAA